MTGFYSLNTTSLNSRPWQSGTLGCLCIPGPWEYLIMKNIIFVNLIVLTKPICIIMKSLRRFGWISMVCRSPAWMFKFLPRQEIWRLNLDPATSVADTELKCWGFGFWSNHDPGRYVAPSIGLNCISLSCCFIILVSGITPNLHPNIFGSGLVFWI